MDLANSWLIILIRFLVAVNIAIKNEGELYNDILREKHGTRHQIWKLEIYYLNLKFEKENTNVFKIMNTSNPCGQLGINPFLRVKEICS